MYANNSNMYANMMGQQAGGMMGGVGQMGTHMSGQLQGLSGQQFGQMQGQLGSHMTPQAGQQQGTMQQQPTSGSGMMPAMPMGSMTGMSSMAGMGNMGMVGMSGLNPAAGATATPATGASGLIGQQASGMMGPPGSGLINQQSTGMMGQQGMNPGMANWQAMAAGNPQAMAAMQAYMQQYAMRMAAYQRMAAAASAGGMAAMGVPGAMGGMGAVGALGAMGGMAGPMGSMAGPMGAMGMVPGMNMMAAQMNQQHHPRGTQQQLQQQQQQQQQHGGQEGGENMRYWKTRICNKWKEGHCPYGDTCKYAHGDSDLRPPNMDTGRGAARVAVKSEAADKRTMIELMKKTRICEEFMKTGSCKYGDKCTFAHGHNELRQVPPNLVSQQQGGKESGSSVHKTRLCERFMNTNSCPYGDKCTFAHGHHELRRPAAGGGAGGNATSSKGQQGAQKQKKQQKSDGGVGSKREREEAAGDEAVGGEAGDQPDAAAKRQHLDAAAGESGGPLEQIGEDEQPQQEESGGTGRWTWGSPSPKRDGGDDADAGELQRRSGDGSERREDEDEELGDRLEGPSGEQLEGGDGEAGGSTGAEAEEAEAEEAEAAADDGTDGVAAGGADDAGTSAGDGVDTAAAAASSGGASEPECRLCAAMVKAGRDKMAAAVQQLGSPAAQKLGAMILGYGTPRFEQLWHKLSFRQLQALLSKSDLSVAERIELLRAVSFHTHLSGGEEERQRLDSQKYVSQGLPPDVADFVAMVLDGKEGSAKMSDYFAALDVCKSLYGVTEDQYFNVSDTMANLFMHM